MSHRSLRTLTVLISLSLFFAPTESNAADKKARQDPNVRFDPLLFQSMQYRNIGPYRGGRSTAVAGVASERDTFYMGTTGGGVWKTTDGGQNWRPVGDGFLGSASVGAIAVADADPNVVYVGTGSACVRGNISPGDGVYRSTDGGESWTHAGLREAGQIGRIRVHPDNPDLVYVAALGHIFGPNEERGVFRSKDGGRTWEKVLYVSNRAGAVDLAMNPGNPRVLFAAIWPVERKPWTLVSGGEEGGLYRSVDGGDNWEKLTDGLPEGVVGKIGVSVSGGRPNRVYALIEADKGGLFRSDDGGKKWRLINPDRNFRQRAWYYTHVIADTKDPETVYILNVGMWRSHNGGEKFEFIRVPHGDNHDLWINPDHPEILIEANDGGANVSYNRGRSWSTQRNQPTAEMYRVSVDDRFPYHVYGCQQDNSCVAVPSRTGHGGITWKDWYVIGGCESGHVAIDPRDPNVTYSGCYGGAISRYDHTTGQDREITAWPQVAVGLAARELKYRFQWNAPIRLSPHDPDVLYHTSQVVHRSRDQGQSWETISPDLSRNDKSKQDYAGEPITRDNTGVEVYGTVFAFEESPQTAGLLWAGTDDGRVHLSRDAGANWQEITPERMPEWGQVNSIELSRHDAGRAFLAVTRYRLDDFRPYIFRTDDYGRSWKLLTDGKNGIPAGHFVRVVREDPDRRGLLYAGTEFGMYVSFDDGRRWQSLQQKLPVSPVTDMQVRHQDLIVATQGRSFWILDDLTPLHQLDDSIAAAEHHLFQPRDAHRFGGGGGRGAVGKNPPYGIVVQYLLPEKDPAGEIVLEFLDGEGNVLRRLSSLKPEPRAPNPFARFFPQLESARKLPTEKGMNRYVWNLRMHDATLVDDAVIWGFPAGPRVPPGEYRVKMTVHAAPKKDASPADDGPGEPVWTATRAVTLRKDPRLTGVTQGDLVRQFELSKLIWDSLNEVHRAVMRIRDVREQVAALSERLESIGKGDEALADSRRELSSKLDEVESRLHQSKARAPQDILNYTQGIDGQLVGLKSVVEGADARPTDAAESRYKELRAELDGHLEALRRIMDEDLAAFNDVVRGKDVPPVFPSKGVGG